MPVAGGLALGSLPEAGRGERRGSCDHGADRSAVSGSALLRLAADGGVVGDAGPCRQSQTGPTPDAAAGTGGDLSTPEHEQTGSGPQDTTRTSSVGSRSSGSIRYGARTLPTSRWPKASST